MLTKICKTQISLKMLLTSAVFLVILSSKTVHAVACNMSTSSVCQPSDVVDGKCENNVCVCKNGFPIPSGCARYLGKPTVKLSDPSRANVIANATTEAQLICSLSSSDLTDITYEWKKDGIKTTEFTSVYSTTSGNFSCRAMYKTYNASDESAPLEITVFDSTKTKLNITVTGVPKAADINATYNAGCSGIPFGAKPIFKITGTEQHNPIPVSNKGNITCGFETFTSNFTSNVISTPSIATEIDSVEIQAVGAEGTEFIYNNNTKVVVNCICHPNAEYMSEKINYTITDVSSSTKSTNEKSVVIESSGNHTVTCTVVYNNTAPKTSPSKTITLSNNYIKIPHLKADGLDLLSGSRLVLTCVVIDNVTYTWYKNDTLIPLQTDRIIQMDNFGEGDATTYYCKAKKNNYVVQSNAVKITLAVNISAPTIVSTDDDKYFYEKENYVLECRTASATVGMTYSWKKDSQPLVGTESLYNLTGLSGSKNNGNYTCKAAYQNKTAESAAFAIIAKPAEPGKPCSKSGEKIDCAGNEYTTICGATKPYRCECKAGYKIKDAACQKGSTIVGSAILLYFGLILSKLM